MSTEPLQIESNPSVSEHTCERCGERFQRVTAFVYRGMNTHAVYFASCYHHDGHEVFIDAVFSPTWEEGVDDHVTFGCRVGPVDGQTSPAASLTTAGAAFSDKPLFGLKLSREQALTHPLIDEFWALVDHVLVNDSLVRNHVYGPGASFA